ncbi:MAG: cell division protein ZapA [Clostridia bacterium]|nr:cell division protein ZapA [Clostridia bacterium]
MLNRIVVTIDGLTYTVIAEETEEYIRKNAALVNKEIEDIKAATPFSSMTAAVLAGMNIADKYYKALSMTEGLRQQVKEYAKENAELRTQLNKIKKK